MNRVKFFSNGQTLIMNLADIPHGALIGSKDFDDGRHIDFYEALPGTQVIAYDEATGKPKWVDISGWSRHTGSKLELVQLSNGDTITTDDDPRAVYGMPIDAVDLQMDRDTPSNAKKRAFIIPLIGQLPELTPVFSSVDILNGGVPSNDTPIPSKGIIAADYDFGQFLGLIAGDGWWHKRIYGSGYKNAVLLADLYGSNAGFIINWAKELFPSFKYYKSEQRKELYSDRFGDCISWSFHFYDSMMMCDALSNMLDGHSDNKTSGSGNKRLPYWFLSMPKEFRLGLLNGLMASDGTINLNSSGDRSHPELQLQFTSTSRALIDDIKALCASLDIRATILFSKKTVRDNTSWVVVLSSQDCKRMDVFSHCCCDYKRDTFLNADVSMDAQYNHGDFLPLPKQVSDTMFKYVKCRAKIAKAVIEDCPLPAYCKRGNSVYQSLYQYRSKGYITREFAGRLCDWLEDTTRMSLWFNDYIKDFTTRLKNGERVFKAEEGNTLVEAIAFNAAYFDKPSVLEARAKSSMLRQKTSRFPVNLPEALEKVTLSDDAILFNPVEKDPVLRAWLELSACPIKWAYIEDVQKTGQEEEGYDLTVPGYETFASASGIILSNTMTYYVPVSKKAVQEAYDLMLPSKNQLAARNFKALPELQEELVSGAWLASHKKNAPVKAVFNTRAEAIAAYRAGDIDVDDNVIIKSEQ